MAEIRYLDVDISDLQETIDRLRRICTPSQAERILHDTCVDTAKYVKGIVSREVPKEYDVTQAWVRRGIGKWRREDGNHVGVVIPLTGKRGAIGRNRQQVYKLGRGGSRGRPVRGRRYVINAKILRRMTSRLPATIPHQGGQPPFIGAGVVYTRKYPKRARPIVRVVGLGVPQMPLNRAADQVVKQIHDRMAVRLEHNINRVLGNQ